MRPLAALCLIAALLAGGRASAHAQLVAADPPAGAVVAQAPRELVLEFSEPVRVLATRWFPADGGPAREVVPRAEGTRLVVPVPAGLGRGTQTLSWRVVSVDGHPVGGSHVFSIGAPTDARKVQMAETAWPAAVGRGALTFALVFGVGGAVFLRLIDRGPAPVARRLAFAAALAVAPAAVLALGLQGLDLLGLPAGALARAAPWKAALASPFAGMAAASLLAGLAAALALRRQAAAWAPVAWGLAALSFALFGHAATAPPRFLTAPAVALHAAAFVFWIGALPGLAERAGRGGGTLLPVLRRFSALAVPLVAGLAASGALLAVVQVGRPAALVTTAYGRLLTVKLALVALLLLLAALNRFRLTPAIARGARAAPGSLRRSVAAEIVLGVLILAVASGFRLTPPPRALAAVPAEAYLHLHGQSAMVDLTLTPGRVGPNTAAIGLQTADFGPLAALEVAVAFSAPERGLEPIRLDAVRDGAGWRAGPVQLPQAGAWTVTVEVLVSDFVKETLNSTVVIAP